MKINKSKTIFMILAIIALVFIQPKFVYAEEFITTNIPFTSGVATENYDFSKYDKATVYAGATTFAGSNWGSNGTSYSSVTFALYSAGGNLIKKQTQTGSAATLTIDLSDVNEIGYFVVSCNNGSNITYTVYDWWTSDNSWHGPRTETGHATSSASSLTLYAYKTPKISSNLTDVTTTEDKDAILHIDATFPSGTEDYQWMYSHDGTSWENCTDGDDYSGSTSNILIAKTPTLNYTLDDDLRTPHAYSGIQYKCKCASGIEGVADTYSDIGTLTVLPKDYDSIVAKASRENMQVGEILDINDVIVILKYNNDTFKVATGFSNLSFVDSYDPDTQMATPDLADGAVTSKTIVYGTNNFTVLLNDASKHLEIGTLGEEGYEAAKDSSCTSTFTVQGIDTTPPEINPIDAKWTASEEPYIMSAPTKDTLKTITLTALATDNGTATENLVYEWKKRGADSAVVPASNANSLELASDKGNGEYYVVVKDTAGNITESESITINAWDTIAPTFTLSYDPDITSYSLYKDVRINAIDNIALADRPYCISQVPEYNLLSEDDFSFINSYTIGENGTYYIYVRDAAGNYTTEAITINTVDHLAPSINSIIPSRVDDTTMKLTVDAADAGSDALEYKLELNGNVKCDWQSSPEFSALTESGTYDLYVRDTAGNITHIRTDYISLESITGTLEEFNAGGISSMVSRFPLTATNGNVTFCISCNNPTLLYDGPAYSWDGGITWTNETEYVVEVNGTYTLTIRDAGGNTHNSEGIVVSNIDKAAPTLSVVTNGQNNSLTINVADEGCGLDKISWKIGNGIDELTIRTFAEGTYEGSATVTVPAANTTYHIYVHDKAGNYAEYTLEVGDVLTDNDYLTPEAITAAISYTPNTWTKGNITFNVALENTNGLATNPYSWDNGENWIATPNYSTAYNGSYVLWVKDIYGNIYWSNEVVIDKIDKIIPAVTTDISGTSMTIYADDDSSGISRIAWVGGTVTTQTNLKVYDDYPLSATYTVDIPANGNYTIYVYDQAGNCGTTTRTVSGISSPTTGSSTTTNNYYTYNYPSTTTTTTTKSNGSGSTPTVNVSVPDQSTALKSLQDQLAALGALVSKNSNTTTAQSSSSDTGNSTSSKQTNSSSSSSTMSSSSTDETETETETQSAKVLTAKNETVSTPKEDTSDVVDVDKFFVQGEETGDASATEAVVPESTEKKKSPLSAILLVIGFLALCGVAGGGYWYYCKNFKKSSTDDFDGFEFDDGEEAQVSSVIDDVDEGDITGDYRDEMNQSSMTMSGLNESETTFSDDDIVL